MNTQLESDVPAPVTAQAPAMVSVANQVGEPNELQEAAVLSLKVAVSRFDIATIEPREGKEVLVSFEDVSGTRIDYDEIPHDDLVHVFRAVDELRHYLSRPKQVSGLDITIQKHIPFGTHLGGSAATSAAVLVALAALWDASIAREDLAGIAESVSEGVSAAITGGAVITSASATEELVTPVLVQSDISVVIVPAAAELEPAEMFQKLQMLRQAKAEDAARGQLAFDSELIEAVSQGDAKQLALMMHNDFQSALLSFLPDHNDWLTAGMNEGALAAQTIDRGPSLVFIADSFSSATEIAERFEQRMEISAVAEYGPVVGAQLLP